MLGGFRAYRRSALLRMGLPTQSQENWLTSRYDLINTWEVGGVIRGAKLGLRMKEIPGDEPKRIGGITKTSILRNGSMVVLQILYELYKGKKFIK